MRRPLPRLLPRWPLGYRLHHVYERLLGTEVEIQVVASHRDLAQRAEQAGLAELDRLTWMFNRFDPDSELRRWLAQPGRPVPLGPELLDVLRRADHWRVVSGGAFHPGADALGALWQAAAAAQRLPDSQALAGVVAELRSPPWILNPDGTATLHTTLPLGLNALAKGVIVDRVAERIAAGEGVRQVLVNAGGDLRTLGARGLRVAVADPFTVRDDAPPVAYVRVQDGALASSGNAHRGHRIGGRWYSHILDPRSGQPVEQVAGVSVTAPECATADALATVVGVLGPQQGLRLVDAEPGCAALVVLGDGRMRASARWSPLTLT